RGLVQAPDRPRPRLATAALADHLQRVFRVAEDLEVHPLDVELVHPGAARQGRQRQQPAGQPAHIATSDHRPPPPPARYKYERPRISPPPPPPKTTSSLNSASP